MPPDASKALAATVFPAALEIAKERREWTRQMREALLAGDTKTALAWARKLCGLPPLGFPTLENRIRGQS